MKTLMKLGAVGAIAIAAAFLAFGREVESNTIGLIQWISNQGAIARKDNATPGQAYATEFFDAASNQVASLSIGTPDGKRVPVADPFALRRRVAEYVDYPDFYIECGDGARLYDAKTVRVFENVVIPARGGSAQDPTIPPVEVTRSFKLKPLNGRYLLSLKYKKSESSTWGESLMNNNFAKIEATQINGEICVEVQFSNNSTDKQIIVNYLDVKIVSIAAMAGWQNDSEIVDDMSDSLTDYYFTDNYARGSRGWSSTFSLGRMRTWIESNYGGKYHIENWSSFAATNAVNLNNQTIWLGRNSFITTSSETALNDTQTWRVGSQSKVAWRVGGGSTSEGDTFSIIQIEVGSSSNHPDYDYVWTSTHTANGFAVTNVQALACYDLVSHTWIRPEGQSSSLTVYKGSPAWCIAIPHDDTHSTRFYKTIADLENGTKTESDPYMYTELPVFAGGGIALKDTAGKWRKLVIDGTTGAISTELIPDDEIPAGVDAY